MLRLELLPPDSHTTPAALAHLSRYVVIDGLSSVPLSILQPGQSIEARISFCLMAEGNFSFKCSAEELRTEEEELNEIRESRLYKSLSLEIQVVN